jgi:hypothetical protein
MAADETGFGDWTLTLAGRPTIAVGTGAGTVPLEESVVGADVAQAAGTDEVAGRAPIAVVALTLALQAEAVAAAEDTRTVIVHINWTKGCAVGPEKAAIADTPPVIRAAESVVAAYTRSRAAVVAQIPP